MKQSFNGQQYTVVSSDQLQNMVNTGQDLTYVVNSKVTDMGEPFKDKQVIGDISTWDVLVFNMTSTFEDTNVDIDISNWLQVEFRGLIHV